MEILYEDAAVLVAVKPPELISEQTPRGDGFADLLSAHVGGYIGVVHRLDRGVGGVMVYAKTQAAAAALSRQIQEHRFQKEYLALVHGALAEKSGSMRDLLFHDRMCNKTFVVERTRRGVKEALLDYAVLQVRESEAYGTHSLVKIRLHTGRTHQIRVQFSHRGHPLLGDGKYGARDRCPIALFCHRLAFPHPVSKKELVFSKAWEAADPV